jgi:hypothetical protein
VAAKTSDYMKTFTSFSGSDLVVSFAGVPIGELQSISWGVQREKAPIYTLGSPDVRSFSRGKRGIAGNLVFAVFDRDALIEEMRKAFNAGTNWPVMFTAAGNHSAASRSKFDEALSMADWNKRVTAATGKYVGFGYGPSAERSLGLVEGRSAEATAEINKEFDALGTTLGTPVFVPAGFDLITPNSLTYVDTIPPFDITATFANEYGQAAFMRILDCDLLNDGSGVSVDTVVMERAMTFVARRISPITSGAYTGTEVIGGGGRKFS